MPTFRTEDAIPVIKHRFVDLLHFRSTYSNLLTADILEKYRDTRMRNIDAEGCKQIHSHLIESLSNPRLVKMLADAEIGGRIQETYVVPSAIIKTRNMRETYVFFDIETLDGSKFPPDGDLQRGKAESVYFYSIANVMAEEEWYKELSTNDRLDSKKKKEDARLNVKLCYQGVVPDTVVVGMHFRACATLCSFVEPLTFYWQSVMTDDWMDGKYGQTLGDIQLWIPIERTALLVIFYLQYCGLLPNLIKGTSLFDRKTITWQHVKDWDAGKPFFSPEFYEKERRKAKRSKLDEHTIGELFAMMLRFYIYTCPIDNGEFYFDSGKYKWNSSTNKQKLLIDTTLIQFPTEDDDKFPLKAEFCKIIFQMNVECTDSPNRCRPAEELINIRRSFLELYSKRNAPPKGPTAGATNKRK